jgi:hypothetical protein
VNSVCFGLVCSTQRLAIRTCPAVWVYQGRLRRAGIHGVEGIYTYETEPTAGWCVCSRRDTYALICYGALSLVDSWHPAARTPCPRGCQLSVRPGILKKNRRKRSKLIQFQISSTRITVKKGPNVLEYQIIGRASYADTAKF